MSWNRNAQPTGIAFASANLRRSAHAASFQPLPPTIAIGRSAPASSARSRSISAAAGAACTSRNGSVSGTAAVVVSTSSGSASTTGPLRPDIAQWKAWLRYSGTRSARSIDATHFAIWPNIRR